MPPLLIHRMEAHNNLRNQNINYFAQQLENLGFDTFKPRNIS